MVLIIETEARYKQLFLELAKSLKAQITIEKDDESVVDYISPTNEEVLDSIERGYRQAQLHAEGKIELSSLDEFLNDRERLANIGKDNLTD
jgi:cystathionine beta-lyase family protein involved in aluminum resistance